VCADYVAVVVVTNTHFRVTTDFQFVGNVPAMATALLP
jgi:hypothetical protein